MTKEEISARQQQAAQFHAMGYNCAQSVACAFADKVDLDKTTHLFHGTPHYRILLFYSMLFNRFCSSVKQDKARSVGLTRYSSSEMCSTADSTAASSSDLFIKR